MDPVPHVPPEEMGFQHLASEARQSPAEEEVLYIEILSHLKHHLKHQQSTTKNEKKLNMLRDACFAEEPLTLLLRINITTPLLEQCHLDCCWVFLVWLF